MSRPPPNLPRLNKTRDEITQHWTTLGLGNDTNGQASVLRLLQDILEEHPGINFRSNAGRDTLLKHFDDNIVHTLPSHLTISRSEAVETIVNLWQAFHRRLVFWSERGESVSDLPPSHRGFQRARKSGASAKTAKGTTSGIEKGKGRGDNGKPSKKQGERKEISSDEMEISEDSEDSEQSTALQSQQSESSESKNSESEESESENSESWKGMREAETEEGQTQDLKDVAQLTPPQLQQQDMPQLLKNTDDGVETTSDGLYVLPAYSRPVDRYIQGDSETTPLVFNADVEVVRANNPDMRLVFSLSTLIPPPPGMEVARTAGIWVDSTLLCLDYFIHALVSLGWLEQGESIWWSPRDLGSTDMASIQGQTRLTTDNLIELVWTSLDGPLEKFRGLGPLNDLAVSFAEVPRFSMIIRDDEDTGVFDSSDLQIFFRENTCSPQGESIIKEFALFTNTRGLKRQLEDTEPETEDRAARRRKLA